MYKELNSKKMNNLIKKWAKDLNRNFNKQNIQTWDKHMKRCSTSYVLKELHIKATMSYSTHLLEGLKSKMLITNAGE